MVFAGFHMPGIEAQIREKKPDGTLENPLPVNGKVTIGRKDCDITFPSDVILSDRHASLSNREGKLYLEDLGSLNGTFIKQRQESELVSGDVFLLGRGLFRFVTPNTNETDNADAAQSTLAWTGPRTLQGVPLTAKLERIKLTGEVVEEFDLGKSETTLGRTKGDLIFKNDPFMSGAHACIVVREGRFILQDLNSRNGVFRRVREELELANGDEFFLGEHLFQVEIK